MFPAQSEENVLTATHCTSGIDISVTSERIILLDVMPVLAFSVLDKMIRIDAEMPPGLTT